LVSYSTLNNETLAHYSARDTAFEMPYGFETPYKLHPSIVDSLLQSPLLNTDTGAAPGLKCGIPKFFKQLYLGAGWTKLPLESFFVRSTTEEGRFTVEASSSSKFNVVSMLISGLQLRAAQIKPPVPAGPRQLCFKVEWHPVCEIQKMIPAPSNSFQVVIVIEAKTRENDPLLAELIQTIQINLGVQTRVMTLLDLNSVNGWFIVLLELYKPVLSSISPKEFERVKQLFCRASGFLWVTRGASKRPTNPDMNIALGLIRTARSEREAVAAILDLDPLTDLSSHGQAALVQDAFRRITLAGHPVTELEFAEDQGRLMVPRIIADEEMNMDIYRELNPSVPYLQNFSQPDRQLRLSKQSSCDNLYFEDCVDTPLADSEIEILVAASTISQADVSLLKEDQTLIQSSVPTLRGCSGTVTRLGISASGFAIGDRVCVLSESATGTHARALTTSASIIPHSIDIKTAATIPHSFAAVYYALVEVARLRASERILLPISGPISLAALVLSRYIGAETFVLVDNRAQRDAAYDLGLSKNHILRFDDINMKHDLDKATGGDGIDVILTGNAADSRAWPVLAEFGRFVEINGFESQPNNTSLPKLGCNTTFTSVSLAGLAASRPKVMERTIKTVMGLFDSGALRQRATEITVPVSQLSNGLQIIRGGAVNPVTVLAGPNELVNVSDRSGRFVRSSIANKDDRPSTTNRLRSFDLTELILSSVAPVV
jgi:NADPH:quinone reductase-like Zn-dependent oxidoreductase